MIMLSVGLGAIGGIVAAEETTEPEELLNETDSVDEDLLTAWVDVTAKETVDGESTDVEVAIHGINTTSGDEVELYSDTMSVTQDTTETTDYEFSDSDRDEYDEFRVVVDGVDEDVEEIEWGTTMQFVGGGGGAVGGLLDFELWGIPAIAIVGVVLIGYWVTRD